MRKKIAANVHHWIAMAFTQERHEACHSTVHRGICNSHFDNGVCNGTSLILKLDKILLIVRGVTIAYWKHWSNAAKGTQGFFFNPFCSRGWEIYKPRKLKIVASILIRGHSITTWTRWGGRGSKNVCFCPRSGYKDCPRRGGVSKNGKILST